jgi:hypothetical protein
VTSPGHLKSGFALWLEAHPTYGAQQFEALESWANYKSQARPVVVTNESLEAHQEEGKRKFLDALETSIQIQQDRVAAHLTEIVWAPRPWWYGEPIKGFVWPVWVRWWWRSVREWIAVKILRVDIYQQDDGGYE